MSDKCWKRIRLDLAPNPGFPRGSAGRAYLLHLPVDAQERIDSAEIERNPGRATVRRFWSSEPDEYGQVVQADGQWHFRYEQRANDAIFRPGPAGLQIGSDAVVESPDGVVRRFRVTSMKSLEALPQRQR